MNFSARLGTGISVLLAFGAALILGGAGIGMLPPQGRPAIAAATLVSISVPDRVAPGSNFTATVNIGQVVNLHACSYDISFDPAKLQLKNVARGSIGGTAILVDIWREKSPGVVAVVQRTAGSNIPVVSGSGSLALLEFSVIGSLSQGTGLNFLDNSDRALSDNLAYEIAADWTGALIQAVSPPAAPASFSLSDFSVTPREVGPVESVTVSVLVTNTGGSGGTYTLVLKVNGVKEEETAVVLGASQIQTVSFRVAKSTGNYSVDVNGKTGAFTVAAPPPPVTPVPPPTTATPPTQTPAAPAIPPAPGIQPSTTTTPPGSVEDAVRPSAGSPSPESVTPKSQPTAAAASPPPYVPRSGVWPWVWGIIGVGISLTGFFVFFRATRKA